MTGSAVRSCAPGGRDLWADDPAHTRDPKLIAAARELRDRYLKRFNATPNDGASAAIEGKYDLSRAIAADVTLEVNTPLETRPQRLLEAA